MKRIVIFVILCVVVCCGVVAQPGNKNMHTPHHPTPPAASDQIDFRSLHGETFVVYVDGLPVNKVPQAFVTLRNMGDYQHEVIVVMQHPQQRAVVATLSSASPKGEVIVGYDHRSDQIQMEPRGCNLSYYYNAPMENRFNDRPPEPQPEPQILVASEEEVASMVVRLKSQSFDSDRMVLCQTMVPTAHLLSSQIARLAETFDFSTNQVEFLKFAFPYCVDPNNYYKTTDILTYSTDKKAILDHINENR